MNILNTYLANITDPRRGQGRRYQLVYILFFSILAIMSGANSYRKIQKFIDAHRRRFNVLFGLNWKRAPAHTSLRQILHKVDEEELEKAFREHAQSLLQDGSETSGAFIACDGKALRGSFDHVLDQKATQLLKAFAGEEKIILGHIPITEKSHEIQAVQQLIQELGLTGCIFTMDALHCQKKLLRQQI